MKAESRCDIAFRGILVNGVDTTVADKMQCFSIIIK